jgi:hypothetical protein
VVKPLRRAFFRRQNPYHSNLLYSDGAVPFGNEVGLSQIANLYNLGVSDHVRRKTKLKKSRSWATMAN